MLNNVNVVEIVESLWEVNKPFISGFTSLICEYLYGAYMG